MLGVSGGGPVGPGGGPDGPASDGGVSMPSIAPNAPSSIEPKAASSAFSRACSAEVFFAAMVVPDYAIPRGLNSGSVTARCLRPAWCRGYHAGLSFLRPGFNSRSGRHTILLPSERVHRPVFVPLWRASDTTSTATRATNRGSSRVEFGTSTRTQ